MKKRPLSLKWGLLMTIAICWFIPISLIVTMAGVLLGTNYEHYIDQELDSGIQNAMDQVQRNLEDVFESSKSVSYDGIIRSAYRTYQDGSGNTSLYRTITEYLTQSFSRNDRIEAVFITFEEDSIESIPFINLQDTTTYETLRNYRNDAEPQVLENMAGSSTEIYFIQSDATLYVARNLLDSRFHAYAAVVIQCNPELILQPFSTLTQLTNVQIQLDQCIMQLDKDGSLEIVDPDQAEKQVSSLSYSLDIQGHTLTFTAQVFGLNLWTDMPELRIALLLVSILVLPLIAVVVSLFYNHVTKPMETLVEAAGRVQNGERGYVIEQMPDSAEFRKLYGHFNAMSLELEHQFAQSYLEQQALQQAKIKALQSQINPHFLNNTLEIINWEARIAGNDQVSSMIEALSTMLDAALDRDGRINIPLAQELNYVDAYLHIITRRLGDSLTIEKHIDDAVLDQMVPRLVLQPIVENAIEHDITARRGGNVCIRAYMAHGNMVLEVEHDGFLTETDLANIRNLLATPTSEVLQKGQVGLRNVNQRLHLIYGNAGTLTVEEISPGTILARVTFPASHTV